MTEQKLIAPSILSADFGRLREEIKNIETAGADIIHVDVMDGHFVPNITIGPAIVASVRRATKLPIDCHLMIEHPENFIPTFVEAGSDYISVHVEQGFHLDRTLNLIKSFGAKAGVAINPATSIHDVFSVLDIVDYLLIMTVNPGFGNQKFIPYCIDKIKTLNDEIKKRKLNALIEVDGGIKLDNIAKLSACGTNIFVAGSAIFHSKSYKKTIRKMKKLVG